MAGQKKKLRYSEETPWFPKYYIASIEIGNCDQETSNKQLKDTNLFLIVDVQAFMTHNEKACIEFFLCVAQTSQDKWIFCCLHGLQIHDD